MIQRKYGFTLIELSIVLVIIGLIVAGVMVGKSLLRSSELRSVTAEVATYTQALGAFVDKYKSLPGDMSNAESLWGADVTCPTTATNIIPKTVTCNGDGDGLITRNVTATRLDEQFRAWQHLANAEMIKMRFTGVAGSAGVRDRVVGQNIPASQLIGAGWGLISVTLTDIAGAYGEIPYTAPDAPPNHVLWLGGRSVSGVVDSQRPVLTASEALYLDMKSDDSLPGSGKIVAQTNGGTGTCSTSATAYNSSASSDLTCALVFKTGF